jgi:crotonobetainyl-CoA:carnitine CoA-transferase CaiB-like acyl-CoA transferase
VGEHNEEVLGLLGYSTDEIAKLYASGVISSSHHFDTLSG